MSGESDLVDIDDAEIVYETERAYLINAGGKEKIWVPKSQCAWDPSDKTMTMPMWLAKEKGFV